MARLLCAFGSALGRGRMFNGTSFFSACPLPGSGLPPSWTMGNQICIPERWPLVPSMGLDDDSRVSSGVFVLLGSSHCPTSHRSLAGANTTSYLNGAGFLPDAGLSDC